MVWNRLRVRFSKSGAISEWLASEISKAKEAEKSHPALCQFSTQLLRSVRCPPRPCLEPRAASLRRRCSLLWGALSRFAAAGAAA